jgi:hypothetical protein
VRLAAIELGKGTDDAIGERVALGKITSKHNNHK